MHKEKEIEQRKKAEQTLRDSEAMYRTLLSYIPQKIFYKDVNSIYVLCSESYARDLNLNPSEIKGKTDYDFFSKKLAEKYRVDDKKVIQSGRVEEVEEMYIKDKEEFTVKTIKVPVKDDKGNVIGILGIFWDITQRKKAEEVLRNSEAQLSNALKIARLGPWEYNIDEGVFTFNDEFYALFHTTAEEMGGYRMSPAEYAEHFLYPEDAHILKDETQKAIDSDDPNFSRQLEHRVIFPNGEIGYITVRFFIVKNQAGRTVRTYGVNQDITERKKAEENLKAAYEKLKQTQQQLIQTSKMVAMGQLAAGISHELNQPLTGIKGFAQIISIDLDEGHPLKKDLEKIIEQANRMDAIIKNVRFFARKSDFILKKINVCEPLEKALALLSQQLTVHDISINKVIAENLPEIQGDPNQLQQVYINLITNAYDAINSRLESKGGQISIKVFLSDDRQNIEIVLEDNGSGMSKAVLENIFNPFFTTKSPGGGMGLGLSIVYRIIENHKGSINVESKEGKGTIVRIRFPVAIE